MEKGLTCATQTACFTGECRPSIAEDLQIRRDRKVAELAEIDTAINLFNEHPEVEQCLTQLAKCGIYR
jgi:hypothetical protein